MSAKKKRGRPVLPEHLRLKFIQTRMIPRHIGVLKRLGGGNHCVGLRLCAVRVIREFEASGLSVEAFFREED